MPFLATRSANSARGFGFAGRVITLPGIPTGFSAVGVANTNANGGARINFTAPTNTGGSPITKYQVQNTNTNVITDITASGQTVPLSVNVGAQNFRIRAVNPAGAGEWTATDSAQCGYLEVGGVGPSYLGSNTGYAPFIPAGATCQYALYSASGSTVKPDTRTYTSIEYVYLANNSDSYGLNYGAEWADGYAHPWIYGTVLRSKYSGTQGDEEPYYGNLGGTYWEGYDSSYNYLWGYYANWFGSYPNRYYLINLYYYGGQGSGNLPYSPSSSPSGFETIGAIYQTGNVYNKQVQTGGNPEIYSPQYGDTSGLYDQNGGLVIAITNNGYNNIADARTGSFIKSSSGNLYYSLPFASQGYPSGIPGEYPYATSGGRLYLGWGI